MTSWTKRSGATPRVTAPAMTEGKSRTNFRIVGLSHFPGIRPKSTRITPPRTKFMAIRWSPRVSTWSTVMSHRGPGRKL